MWWIWPHLRRLWAGVGTITAGLIVTWLYSLLSAQALPHVSIASTLLRDYWPWLAGGLLAFAMVSSAAEQAHRRHQSRAPQPLRVAARPWFRRFHSQAPVKLLATATSTIVGRSMNWPNSTIGSRRLGREPGAWSTASLQDARGAYEARYISQVLSEHGGNISHAALALRVSRVALQKKMKRYGLR
jgi:hypothetical protein